MKHFKFSKACTIALLFCLPFVANAQTTFAGLSTTATNGYKTISDPSILISEGMKITPDSESTMYNNSYASSAWSIKYNGTGDFTFASLVFTVNSSTIQNGSTLMFKNASGDILKTIALNTNTWLTGDTELLSLFGINSSITIPGAVEIVIDLNKTTGTHDYQSIYYKSFNIYPFVNTAPTVTAPDAPTVTENDVNVDLSDNIQIVDAENDNQTVSFIITGGTLTVGETGVTFGGNGNGSANFTAAGSLTDINTALDAATFTPTQDVYGGNAASIAFTTNDGIVESTEASVTFDINEDIPTTVPSESVNNLSFSPNPFTNQIYLNSEVERSNVTILDISGRQVKQVTVQGGEAIDVSNLNKGIYSLIATNQSGKQYITKMIKK